MKKIILVTGGAGYIGSITTKELLDNGFDVVVLDSLENGHKEAVDKRATALEIVNLENKEAVDKVFKKFKFDAVIDFAAYLAVGESMEKPEKYLKNNVFNFVNLLEVMKENGCNLIIKSSTASTYGEPQKDSDFPLKESYTDTFKPASSSLLSGKWNGDSLAGEEFLSKFIEEYHHYYKNNPKLHLNDREVTKLRIPASIYGLSKLLDEIIMSKYDVLSGLKYITLRYFNVAGADSSGEIGEDKPNPTNLMTVTVYAALGKRELQVFGDNFPTKDGTGIRDYIHVSDLARGHVEALKYLLKTNTSNTFNLGTGNGYSVFEIIKSVENAAGKKIEYSIGPRRSGDPAISFSDPTKAKELLNWEAKYTVDDMAKTAWKWHKSHPSGYKHSESVSQ